MNQLQRINVYRMSDFLGLDRASRSNLELTANLRDGKQDGTLLAVLDRTRSPMGRRKLRARLEQPLLDTSRINDRLDAVEELLERREYREELQSVLQRVPWISRGLSARRKQGSQSPEPWRLSITAGNTISEENGEELRIECLSELFQP